MFGSVKRRNEVKYDIDRETFFAVNNRSIGMIEHREPVDIFWLELTNGSFIYPRDMEDFESEQFYQIYNKEPRKKLAHMKISYWCIAGFKTK